jgi:hypothetical protein
MQPQLHPLPEPLPQARKILARSQNEPAVTVGGGRVVRIDRSLSRLAQVIADIERSFGAVDWGDGDDYGPEFLIPPQALRMRARDFAVRLARDSAHLYGHPIAAPEFEPASDGTIDLHWGSGGPLELLMGIRSSGDVASFFGTSVDGTSIKGVVRLDGDCLHLAAWLLQGSR